MEPVRPGDWIKVRVAGDPWPVSMAVGTGLPEAAFIDHPRSGGTVVQRRCPRLEPGVYPVTVRTPAGIVQTEVEVVGEPGPTPATPTVTRTVWNGPR